MVPRANFERQLCESVLCSNLTNVSCRYKGAQLVPPPKKGKGGWAEKKWLVEERFFNPSLPHP